MNHEIEAKIKVATLEPVAEILQACEARFEYNVHQTDTYFMDAAGQLREKDCALRIRQQVINDERSTLITFKGPRAGGRFKNRSELETSVGDADIAKTIIEALGYQKRIEVEKKRMLWQLDTCEVCLDELPELGCFVEVEGPDEETISSVLRKLSLHNEPHITKSYASMMSKIRNGKQV
ncbi:MAG: class IV adenylate cyclase [Planctomycetota bacterium]|jgi:adenylate cyclase class 2